MDNVISNMSVADKLADKIKNSDMGAFFSEDDLLPIARQAIEKAFFTGIPETYNTPAVDPQIVTIAKDALTAEVKRYVEDNFKALVEKQDFQKLVQDVMLSTLVTKISGGFHSLLSSSAHQIMNQQMNELRMMMSQPR